MYDLIVRVVAELPTIFGTSKKKTLDAITKLPMLTVFQPLLSVPVRLAVLLEVTALSAKMCHILPLL